MNREQQRYTIKRIQGLSRQKETEISNEAADERRPLLRGRERMEEILAGRGGKLTLPDPDHAHTYVHDCYEVPAAREVEEHNAAVEEERQSRLNALRAEVSRVKDEIMLGDAEDAMEMLRQFAEKRF